VVIQPEGRKAWLTQRKNNEEAGVNKKKSNRRLKSYEKPGNLGLCRHFLESRFYSELTDLTWMYLVSASCMVMC
jgi:hypothetical protein